MDLIYGNRFVEKAIAPLFHPRLVIFRKIPNLEVTTDLVLVCSDGRYNIISVEDVKGRGMYIEVLAEKVKSSKA